MPARRSAQLAEIIRGEARELDALIAEKIFGWRRVLGCMGKGNIWDDNGVILVPYPPGYAYVKEPAWTTKAITREGSYPHYSTDIAAAWEVLGRFLSFQIDHNNESDDVEVKLWAEHQPFNIYAICLAALASLKGVETP